MKYLWFTAIVAIFSILILGILGQEGVSPTSGTKDKFQPRIPPAPQLTADDLYQQLGRAHAQIEVQQKYIGQLQQELTAAQALCQKPEAEERKDSPSVT